LTRLLAIDTSSAWCSVALSLDAQAPNLRHELLSAGASQNLLPWVDELLTEASITLKDLEAIAVDVGPGAFTGVRLGVAAVQGLAIAANLPVIPVTSLDALASQLVAKPSFTQVMPHQYAIAIDARMDEIYWALYSFSESDGTTTRIGDIYLSKPEDIDLSNAQYIAGSAIKAYGARLFVNHSLPDLAQDADISVSALGVLNCAQQALMHNLQISVCDLEPLYVRDKVALTTKERILAYGKESV
jgi:tRNA threonylcarbamoyladenosine biosynthesis protein TsaB